MNIDLSRLILVSGLASLPALAAPDTIADFCNTIKKRDAAEVSISAVVTADESCRVTSQVKPMHLSHSDDSFIEVYTWLPLPENWNGRFIAFGNGGYSDRIAEKQMSQYLAKGFVVAATDTGHKGDSLTFSLSAPERIDYWGRYAVHALSKASKSVIQHAYSTPPKFSYFSGCSTGGHQALSSVQYFPDDFDGVIAGAPGNNRVALNAAFLWLFQQSHDQHTGKPVITEKELSLVSEKVKNQCGDKAGLSKGVISDLSSCEPALDALRCSGTDNDCLSEEQLTRIQNIYRGPVDPVTGELIYPGFPPDTEYSNGIGWAAYRADPSNPSQPARADFWRIWAFNKSEWDPWRFDWHNDFGEAKRALSPRIDAIKTNLTAFKNSGGKLIIYHGLADPVVSAKDTANYFKKVKIDTKAQIDAKFYEIPGMSHCGGGEFIEYFDAFPALKSWVEENIEPLGIEANLTHPTESKKTITVKPIK